MGSESQELRCKYIFNAYLIQERKQVRDKKGENNVWLEKSCHS